MLRVRRAGLGCPVNRLQAHDPHQTAHTVSTDMQALALQVACHFPTAIKRILHKQGIHLLHKLKRLGRDRLSCVIKAAATDGQ